MCQTVLQYVAVVHLAPPSINFILGIVDVPVPLSVVTKKLTGHTLEPLYCEPVSVGLEVHSNLRYLKFLIDWFKVMVCEANELDGDGLVHSTVSVPLDKTLYAIL